MLIIDEDSNSVLQKKWEFIPEQVRFDMSEGHNRYGC
jgi:hypothetical protein